jgi:type I restriction enzyme S subunit
MNPSMPKGWTLATISGLIGPQGLFVDGDWVESKDQDPDGEVRLTQLADVGDGVFRNRSSRFLRPDQAERLRCTFLQEGDVLVARMPDPLGRACIYPGSKLPAVTAVDVCIIRPASKVINNRWLMWFLNAPQFRNEVMAHQAGTTRKRISRKNLAALPLPVPPFPEQQRIVAAIEEQLSRLDVAEAALARARQRLVRFEELSYSEALKRGPRCRLGDVVRTSSGGTPNRSHTEYFGGSIPWVKSGELGDSVVTSTEENITEAAMSNSSAKAVPKGTVLIAMYGATIGKLGRVGLPMVATNQAVAAVYPNDELDPDYLWNVLRALRSDLIGLGQGGAQPNISQTILRDLEIPVPPLDEQAAVNSSIDRASAVWRALSRDVQVAYTKAIRLRRSLLAAAFSGQLVPQDPDDEPAPMLVERARAELEGTALLKRKKKKNP